jgi:hypothetical protein
MGIGNGDSSGDTYMLHRNFLHFQPNVKLLAAINYDAVH